MKWKCTVCRMVRGKRNPIKAGWQRFVFCGKTVTLCGFCARIMAAYMGVK